MTPDDPIDLHDRLVGTLLGIALGDALGLPAEGMSATAIARRFGRLDRFRLLGSIGFVSDDTEQSALIAQAIARHPDDVDLCVGVFRRSLLGWFGRLPWGVGRATILSCARIALGIRPTGVRSAGNGAAMRAAVVGTFFREDAENRLAFGRALAEVTHLDIRAVEGALYVAEIAAACSRRPGDVSPFVCQAEGRRVVTDPELAGAIDRARSLAESGASVLEAAHECGTSGFVVQTLAFATFAFLRHAGDVFATLVDAVSVGGDSDSIGAILGGWLGALHGESGLPIGRIARIHDGPFGPSHLRALAECLARRRQGDSSVVPGYSAASAMARNLMLYPVILGHGFRRLLPF